MKTPSSSFSFLLFLVASSQAFVPSSKHFGTPRLCSVRRAFIAPSSIALQASADSVAPDPNTRSDIDEVQRLREMAKKLRDEASALATEQAQKMTDAAIKVFTQFDLNNDGTISADELKIGLEKATKHEIPQGRIEKLLQQFDANGDGVLQMEEFVPLERLKNQLDYIAREEKAFALEEAKVLKQVEEQRKLEEMRMAMVNDDEPTPSDKVVSILPYLFPLLESLQFAAPWIISHQDNVVAQVAAVVFTIYKSIPLSGFLVFFALNSVSQNLSLNRLIRFNLKQALFLDVAILVPGITVGLLGAIGSGLGLPASGLVQELLNDAVVFGTLVTIAYASASSLLGVTPEQVPWVSQATNRRMVTRDTFRQDDKVARAPRSGEEDGSSKEE